MFRFSYFLMWMAFSHLSVIAISPSTSNKAILVNWASRLWLEHDMSQYTGGLDTKSLPILRRRNSEKPYDCDTCLSLLLPDTCPEDKCDPDLCTGLEPSESEQTKFVLIKTESKNWVVQCKLFDEVELPVTHGGIPEQRSLGESDRTRGQNDGESPQVLPFTPVMTPSIQGFRPPAPAEPHEEPTAPEKPQEELSGAVYATTSTQAPTLSSVSCDSLFTSDAESFFSDCCMKNGDAESDPRCVLQTLLTKLLAQQQPLMDKEAQQKPSTTTLKPTTAKSTTVKKISDGFGVTEADVVTEEGDSEDTTDESSLSEEFYSPSASEKSVWSLTGQISTWRSKYYTVLGFFLVFLIIFLLVIAALIYKLRAAKASSPPTSPGAGTAGCGGGDYSSYNVSGAQGERAPLTPATQQAQTFQY